MKYTLWFVVKNPAASAGIVRNKGSIPGLGRAPGEGHGNRPQRTLARRTPGTEEPGGLHSMGLQRVGHD